MLTVHYDSGFPTRLEKHKRLESMMDSMSHTIENGIPIFRTAGLGYEKTYPYTSNLNPWKDGRKVVRLVKD